MMAKLYYILWALGIFNIAFAQDPFTGPEMDALALIGTFGIIGVVIVGVIVLIAKLLMPSKKDKDEEN